MRNLLSLNDKLLIHESKTPLLWDPKNTKLSDAVDALDGGNAFHKGFDRLEECILVDLMKLIRPQCVKSCTWVSRATPSTTKMNILKTVLWTWTWWYWWLKKYKPVLHARSPESRSYPGLHQQNNNGQQMEEDDSFPILCCHGSPSWSAVSSSGTPITRKTWMC